MLVRISVAAVASAGLVVAQAPSDDSTHYTLASFAFIRTGERTPILRNNTQVLTALGAQQMYTLGENFRTRYIAGDSPNKLGVEHVAGMSVDVIDNDQIRVQTLEKPYLVSSAQAFMQGLYPPNSNSNGTGQVASRLADGTQVDYPLNGYQYAGIQAAALEDPDSRFVSGSQNCPLAQVAALNFFETEKFKETEAANADLFKKLNIDWLEGTLPEAYFNARSALEISDYISYQYSHNSSVYKALSANDSDYTGAYDQLSHLADEVAWHLYGNASDLSTDANYQAIGGKTLASSILNTFKLQVPDKTSPSNSSTPSPRLTFYFGEEDAMLGLISLLNLDTKSPSFKSIPSYASSLIFELFSTTKDQNPNPENLWVRFSFHNATTDDKQLVAYPLFNHGPSNTDMSWTEFERQFSAMAVSGISDWCRTCNSGSLFCWGAEAKKSLDDLPSSSPSSIRELKSRLSPVVGGIIGAVVTLVVAAIVFALVMVFGGVRVHRPQRSVNHDNDGSAKGRGLGGFKGVAKLASDADLRLTSEGAAGADAKRGHERIGSWELKQKDFGNGEEVSRKSSFERIDGVVAARVEPVQRL
ncbi:hypothetical protein COCCADRAFT_7874 [Bipolaris zeicola 26-R-13]|uniref:Phosphoglycerate mutase-like protein n=1 Tax=Cochliobolus carbonum (strain 26-R-13) TaxID=930089 RepID=W6Y4N0_COCC2|nr:uncharacterized protein COCCADRAFT_7874 [Bipolaris zeicola 26-R-13]EUC30019.1 hypothetical protein COCCADRAFT_7874 [Bipolaris zeicola 26-R-13]